MGNTANDKNTGRFYRKKVIYSKFIRIRPNILLRNDKNTENFTQKSDFIIIDNLCELDDAFPLLG